MKHKREVKIENPRLQALRNNLREILYLEWDKRSRSLIDAKLHIWDSNKSLEEKNLLHGELQIKLEENRKLINPSIVMCGWCHQRNKDAIYNSSNHQWFCPDCYDEHKEKILEAKSYIY